MSLIEAQSRPHLFCTYYCLPLGICSRFTQSLLTNPQQKSPNHSISLECYSPSRHTQPYVLKDGRWLWGLLQRTSAIQKNGGGERGAPLRSTLLFLHQHLSGRQPDDARRVILGDWVPSISSILLLALSLDEILSAAALSRKSSSQSLWYRGRSMKMSSRHKHRKLAGYLLISRSGDNHEFSDKKVLSPYLWTTTCSPQQQPRGTLKG